jgi:uncharacterized protein (DUF427 family)
MIQAVWNGAVLAEAEQTVQLEGNDYFPLESVHREFLTDSSTTTVCPWKGTASYYTVTVDGEVNPDSAWYYPTPSARAQQIANHVAFWKGVRIQRSDES